MRKYWIIFSNTLQKALIYRARNVTYAVVNVCLPLIMVAVWSKYYAGGKTINSFTFNQLVSYYFMTIIVSLWSSRVHENVKEDIKDGELANYVIKPFDYFGFRISWELGWYVIKFVLLLLPLGFLFLNFQPQININIFALISLIFSYLLSYCFSMIIGLTAFHTTETTGITNLYWMLTELFTGKVFPITLFALSVQKILNFLPFKYMVYFPVQIAIGKLSATEITRGLLMQFFWIVGLYLLARLIWKRGVKKFSGIGL